MSEDSSIKIYVDAIILRWYPTCYMDSPSFFARKLLAFGITLRGSSLAFSNIQQIVKNQVAWSFPVYLSLLSSTLHMIPVYVLIIIQGRLRSAHAILANEHERKACWSSSSISSHLGHQPSSRRCLFMRFVTVGMAFL
ncbi:UNVERIFIED_CONTAM: hypothetical protein Sindi_1380400 [Sesamum indicum]